MSECPRKETPPEQLRAIGRAAIAAWHRIETAMVSPFDDEKLLESKSGLLWTTFEVLFAFGVERVVSRFFPSIYAYFWLTVVGGFTLKLLRTKTARAQLVRAYAYWKAKRPMWESYAIIFLIGGAVLCAYWFGIGKALAKFETKKQAAPADAMPSVSQFEGPRLTEATTTVDLIVGSNGFPIPISELRNAKDGVVVPFGINGQLPIRLTLQDTRISIDADVYAGPNQASVHVNYSERENRLTLPSPSDWDINMSERALEVVDDKLRPVFQLIRRRPSQIEINGIFPTTEGIMLCSATGKSRGTFGHKTRYSLDAIFEAGFSLEPIFRYPSWKYPGVYVESLLRDSVPPQQGQNIDERFRRLTEDQKQRLIDLIALHKEPMYPVYVRIRYLFHDFEAYQFAEDFRDVFRIVGWNFGNEPMDHLIEHQEGLSIAVKWNEYAVPSQAHILADALKQIGINVKLVTTRIMIREEDIALIVGQKDY